MNFHLSMGLFSSNSIDSGTLLLLKSIAKELDFSRTEAVADIGCGVGVIAIGLKKKFPQLTVNASDRDALAVAFTQINASLNKVKINTEQGLMLSHLPEHSQDYIFSNIPAKAGDPVLRHLIATLPLYLKENGKACVVIVNTLAEALQEMITSSGFSIDFKDASRQHTVYHFSLKEKKAIPSSDHFPYIRYSGTFDLENTRYKMNTVFNIPDFDTPGYRLQLSASLLEKIPVRGKVLCWNPGQGHLPVWLTKRSRGIKPIILAGRDILQLKIAQMNLEENRFNGEIILLPASDIRELTGKENCSECELFIADLQPIPRTPWNQHLTEAMKHSVSSGCMVLLSAKSADMHVLLKNLKGFIIDRDKRSKGIRAVLLRKV